MNVYDIITAYDHGQTPCVVADSMAEAERIFLGKYWPTEIQEIRLHSTYVQVQGFDEQPKEVPK